jgi:hypothetical protein
MKTWSLLVAGSAAVLAMCAVAAQAAPMSPAPGATESAGTLVEQIHGCHRSVEYDRFGPHYHVGPGCRRIEVEGRRRYEPRYEPRRFCREECKYIGPIKTCETRCR